MDLMQYLLDSRGNWVDERDSNLQRETAMRNEQLNSAKRAQEKQMLDYQAQILSKIFRPNSAEAESLGLLVKPDALNGQTADAQQRIPMQRDIEEERTVGDLAKFHTAIENDRYDLLPELVTPYATAAKNSGDGLGAGILSRLANTTPETKTEALKWAETLLNTTEKGRTYLNQKAKNTLAYLHRQNLAAQTRPFDDNTADEEAEGAQNTPEHRATQNNNTQTKIDQTQAHTQTPKATEPSRISQSDAEALSSIEAITNDSKSIANETFNILAHLFDMEDDLPHGARAWIRSAQDALAGKNEMSRLIADISTAKFEPLTPISTTLKGLFSDDDLKIAMRNQPDPNAGPEATIDYLSNKTYLAIKATLIASAQKEWMQHHSGIGDPDAYNAYMMQVGKEANDFAREKVRNYTPQNYLDRNRTRNQPSSEPEAGQSI